MKLPCAGCKKCFTYRTLSANGGRHCKRCADKLPLGKMTEPVRKTHCPICKGKILPENSEERKKRSCHICNPSKEDVARDSRYEEMFQFLEKDRSMETRQKRGYRLEDNIEKKILEIDPRFTCIKEREVVSLYGTRGYGIDFYITDGRKDMYVQVKARTKVSLPEISHFMRAVKDTHDLISRKKRDKGKHVSSFMALWLSECEPTETSLNYFYEANRKEKDGEFDFIDANYDDLPAELEIRIRDFFCPPQDKTIESKSESTPTSDVVEEKCFETGRDIKKEMRKIVKDLMAELPQEDLDLFIEAIESECQKEGLDKLKKNVIDDSGEIRMKIMRLEKLLML